ncbi:MAG TPA: YggS family pyridoxal phosphate-dependent enzyme [Cytophagales bacterium]|nr:YggS family pyridoxal phosphate-dependent enzyme [Cytophagales bacterium]
MSLESNLVYYRKVVAPYQAKLVVVSKTHPVDLVLQAYHQGQRIFGENRVQELVEKHEALPKDIEWHLIGTLQKNKVKYIAGFVSLIHSIDSLELLKEVNKQAFKAHRVLPCLLQVHIAEEETKHGFLTSELIQMIQQGVIQEMHHVKILGLMGMATHTTNKDKIRAEFATLKDLFDRIKSLTVNSDNIEMRELSMGMSGDFEEALAQGSTMIRIGTAIFGNR